MEEIKAYSLQADESIIDHDAVCTAQAGKLMQIGYLEYETAAYGTAVYRDGDIYYYISAKEDTVTQFVQHCHLQGLYPMPIRYFFKRYDLLHHSEEEVRQAFRLYVARQLQAAYPRAFFDSLKQLTAPSGTNAAWPVLHALTKQLDSCFDLKQLTIFDDLLETLLPARLLSVEGYQLLQQWLAHEYEKLSIEPTKAGTYQRTYAGFAYQRPDGQLAYFTDAFPYMAHEKRILFINQGCLTTPILTHTYYADSYPELALISEKFKTDLHRYLGSDYLNVMQLLRELPPAVDQAAFNRQLDALRQDGTPQAVEALRYYGSLWNAL